MVWGVDVGPYPFIHIGFMGENNNNNKEITKVGVSANVKVNKIYSFAALWGKKINFRLVLK